jgi:hypothetical protein
MRIEILLRRFEEAQATLAKEALQQPQERDGFEYGRVVGLYAGLELAKSIMLDLIDEKERRDFDL